MSACIVHMHFKTLHCIYPHEDLVSLPSMSLREIPFWHILYCAISTTHITNCTLHFCIFTQSHLVSLPSLCHNERFQFEQEGSHLLQPVGVFSLTRPCLVIISLSYVSSNTQPTNNTMTNLASMTSGPTKVSVDERRKYHCQRSRGRPGCLRHHHWQDRLL